MISALTTIIKEATYPWNDSPRIPKADNFSIAMLWLTRSNALEKSGRTTVPMLLLLSEQDDVEGSRDNGWWIRSEHSQTGWYHVLFSMSWTTHLATNPSAILAKMSVSDIGLILSTLGEFTGTTMADFHWLGTTPSKEQLSTSFNGSLSSNANSFMSLGEIPSTRFRDFNLPELFMHFPGVLNLGADFSAGKNAGSLVVSRGLICDDTPTNFKW